MSLRSFFKIVLDRPGFRPRGQQASTCVSLPVDPTPPVAAAPARPGGLTRAEADTTSPQSWRPVPDPDLTVEPARPIEVLYALDYLDGDSDAIDRLVTACGTGRRAAAVLGQVARERAAEQTIRRAFGAPA